MQYEIMNVNMSDFFFYGKPKALHLIVYKERYPLFNLLWELLHRPLLDQLLLALFSSCLFYR